MWFRHAHPYWVTTIIHRVLSTNTTFRYVYHTEILFSATWEEFPLTPLGTVPMQLRAQFGSLCVFPTQAKQEGRDLLYNHHQNTSDLFNIFAKKKVIKQ